MTALTDEKLGQQLSATISSMASMIQGVIDATREAITVNAPNFQDHPPTGHNSPEDNTINKN